MKSTLCLGLFLSLFQFSCQKFQSEDQGQKFLGMLSELKEGRAARQLPVSIAWMPDGAKFETQGNVSLITGPEGWSYAGYDTSGRLVNIPSQVMAKITCTCNTSGTCNPFMASGPGGSFSGCGGTCTNCTMLQSGFAVLTNQEQSSILSGGFYNPNDRPHILHPGASIVAVFDALFEIDEFRKQVSNYLSRAYNGMEMVRANVSREGIVTAPEGYCLVPISIMGRGMAAVLPMGFVKNEIGEAVTAKASCSCSDGSCSLKDKSVLGSGVVWCSGDCKGSCSLTLSYTQQNSSKILSSSF